MAEVEEGNVGGILVVDRIRTNINVKVDRARHIPCNVRPDLCSTKHVNIQPYALSRNNKDRPGAKWFLKHTPISPSAWAVTARRVSPLMSFLER